MHRCNIIMCNLCKCINYRSKLFENDESAQVGTLHDVNLKIAISNWLCFNGWCHDS